jgi:hypothetical protein
LQDKELGGNQFFKISFAEAKVDAIALSPLLGQVKYCFELLWELLPRKSGPRLLGFCDDLPLLLLLDILAHQRVV